MSSLLINASNLHAGGGVQVAASFVNEIANGLSVDDKLKVVVSNEVSKNLNEQKKELFGGHDLEVVDTFGASMSNIWFDRVLNDQDVVFTIFGPLYKLYTPFNNVCGFAQPWIIYPNNECYAKLPMIKRLTLRLKYWIQGQFFKRADSLVVELEHVKNGLVRELGIKPERIHVVRNCLSSIYLDEAAWSSLYIPGSDCDLRLGFVGRNYSHKNTDVFPAIAKLLEKSHRIRAKFYVTFTDKEWLACSAEFRNVCINVGPLLVAQCPKFYQSLDGVVFPSLLECFSATPLEAMAMEKPLFVSDRPFNRDICQEHAHYFDPLSPESAVNAIAEVFAGSGPDKEALRSARAHAVAFSSPRSRAEKYLALLTQCASKSEA